MANLTTIPQDTTGLRLCKDLGGDDIIYCEPVHFTGKRVAVNTILRRAAISGEIGPIGETGKYWADFINEDGNWTDTIKLSRGAWNALKNRWMHCKLEA